MEADARKTGIAAIGDCRWGTHFCLFYRTREDLLAGRINWREMTLPEYRPLDERALEEVRELGACIPFEKEYIRNDGRRIPVLNSAVRVDQPSAGLSFIAFTLDLTGRKRAEELLREANRRKDEFLAMLAHELRNPLGAMNNAMEVVRLRPEGDPICRKVHAILGRQMQQMTRLLASTPEGP